jgi:hypothetical protein
MMLRSSVRELGRGILLIFRRWKDKDENFVKKSFRDGRNTDPTISARK